MALSLARIGLAIPQLAEYLAILLSILWPAYQVTQFMRGQKPCRLPFRVHRAALSQVANQALHGEATRQYWHLGHGLVQQLRRMRDARTLACATWPVQHHIHIGKHTWLKARI